MKQIKHHIIASGMLALLSVACSPSSKKSDKQATIASKKMTTYNPGSFGYDIAFLAKRDSIIVLKDKHGEAQVVVSAKYQAKVFTSTADGEKGRSFGWINYAAFDKKDEHMNAYGGEDRLWLGPEGGKFSLFFKPKSAMEFANWYTPSAVDTEPWQVSASTGKEVTLRKETAIANYAGTKLQIQLSRKIEILEREDIERVLGLSWNDGVKTVGFRTTNKILNQGNKAWDKQSGAPCLWSLDMFTPSPETVIIIPFEKEAKGKIATTNYFGEIPKERLVTKDDVLLFKADGKSRGKLGIPPQRVKPIAGSYAADTKVLTITYFDIHPADTYLNQEWTPDKDPFRGDAMNAYNDGPLADGSQMGPFYEIESVSPAAFLKPKEELTHHHYVFHFIGEEKALDAIARKALGISLKEAKVD